MNLRSISIATIAVLCSLDLAYAADQTLSSPALGTRVAPLEAGISSYRQYVRTQTDSLVGMTKVLAREIKNGNLDAAQMAYAPTHRYFERIKPIVGLLDNLHNRMDARTNEFTKKEADPRLSGFHRLEYGLFANRSTAGLSDDADRLDKDARQLRTQLALLEVTPNVLVAGAVRTLAESADNSLSGDEERFSRTDLWDLEARLDGARQVAELVRPGLEAETQDKNTFASVATRFVALNEMLEKHKVGCGFQNYDELSHEDRTALNAATGSLAAELSMLGAHLPKADAVRAASH